MSTAKTDLEVHKDARLRISMAALWGILLCCITATAFIVRLSGQVEVLARELVEVRAESRDLRAQQVQLMKEIAALRGSAK